MMIFNSQSISFSAWQFNLQQTYQQNC